MVTRLGQACSFNSVHVNENLSSQLLPVLRGPRLSRSGEKPGILPAIYGSGPTRSIADARREDNRDDDANDELRQNLSHPCIHIHWGVGNGAQM